MPEVVDLTVDNEVVDLTSTIVSSVMLCASHTYTHTLTHAYTHTHLSKIFFGSLFSKWCILFSVSLH